MKTRQFIVPSGEAGERLDKWLVQKMPDFSRNQIKSLLDRGLILVNRRQVVIAGWELESKDAVEVRLESGERRTENGELKTESRKPKAESRERFLDILYEDRDLLVINKPAGVLAEPKKDSPHENLLNMIKGYLRRKYKEAHGSYIAFLHRLDRDTSGVMVIAKSKAGEQLEDQFRFHKVERHYTALVEGAIKQGRGKIDFPLEKGEFGGGKKVRIAEGGEGRKATTFYEVLERYSKATLVKVKVNTGRTHQIRVHLAKVNHPVIGDKIYGGGRIFFRRQALHASFLGFAHPRTKQKMSFESKLPKDMVELIDELRG